MNDRVVEFVKVLLISPHWPRRCEDTDGTYLEYLVTAALTLDQIISDAELEQLKE